MFPSHELLEFWAFPQITGHAHQQSLLNLYLPLMSVHLIFCVCESILLAPTFFQLILFYFFNGRWHLILFPSSSFRGTASWLDNYIHDRAIPLLSPVPARHRTQVVRPCDCFVTTSVHFPTPAPSSLRPPSPLPSGDPQSVPCTYRSASALFVHVSSLPHV